MSEEEEAGGEPMHFNAKTDDMHEPLMDDTVEDHASVQSLTENIQVTETKTPFN